MGLLIWTNPVRLHATFAQKQVSQKTTQTSSSQHALAWDPVILLTKSHWIPAQKHTGMTAFSFIQRFLSY